MGLAVNDVADIVAEDDKEGRLAARDVIEGYQAALQGHLGSERGEMDEINDNGLTEYFVGGSYTRSLLIPAGITIVSQLWKKERLWIIASGDVTFKTEAGTQRVQGPHVQVAPFGSKVALYAHEDTLWLAVTGADSENSDDAEAELIAKDYSELSYPWDMLENSGGDV